MQYNAHKKKRENTWLIFFKTKVYSITRETALFLLTQVTEIKCGVVLREEETEVF